MRNYKYLIIAPLVFLTTACGSGGMPGRKDGNFCNVTFTGHNVTCDCPTSAPIGRDLQLNLDIFYEERAEAKWADGQEPTADKDGVLDHPNIEYTVSIDDIHVKVGGTEYPDSFTFFYRNNADNVLTIKKEYMVNDIEIEIVAKPRDYLFLFGYELGEELDNRWYGSESAKTDPSERDLFVMFKTPYQQVRKPIRTLSGQPAFPVFEHDDMDVTFEVDSAKIAAAAVGGLTEEKCAKLALPYDLRYRCNARYTYENIDYTREYSEPFGTFKDENGEVRIAYAKCHFKVPHYIVNDHGSFRQFGTE